MSLTRGVTGPVTRPLTRAITAAGSGGAAGFSPLSLFASGEQGAWYDPSDFSTMWQESTRVNQVTAVGQTVGAINDKSGRANHATQATGAARPILRQDGSGFYYLEFDTVDDVIGTTLSVGLWGVNAEMYFAAQRAAGSTVALFNPSRASYVGIAISGGAGVPYDQAGTPVTRVNTTAAATTGALFTAWPASTNAVLNFSAINTATNNWGGLQFGLYAGFGNLTRAYQLAAVARVLTASERTDLMAFCASKSGVTL